MTEDETNKIKEEITSGIESSISDGKFDWQNMANGSTTTIEGYTVTKNQDGSFTFSKSDPSDPQEGSLSDDDIDKLFGKGYNRDKDGNLVDKDGNVITISGNTVTVTTETKVEITENTGSESFDADLVFSDADANSDVAKIFDKLTSNGNGYKFDGQDATVTKDGDGNITKIIVGDTTYEFEYQNIDDPVSVTDPNEIVKLLGEGYSYNNGKYYKGTSEITLDNINEALKAQSVKVNVTTTTQNETIVDSGSSTNDFDYGINDNLEYESWDEAYNSIISQITGTEYNGGDLPETDKNDNQISLTYDESKQTITITTTILASKLTKEEIAALLGSNYHADVDDNNIYDSNGNLVEVTFDENETVTLKTTVQIGFQTKHEIVQVPGEVTGSDSQEDGTSIIWSDKQLGFYIRLDGQIVDYGTGAPHPNEHYTTSVSVGSQLGYKSDGTNTNPLPTTDKTTWIYQETVDQPTGEDGIIGTSAGEVINSYFDLDVSNNIDTDTNHKDFVIKNAPSDADVFAKIFESSYNKDQAIQYRYYDANNQIQTATLTKEYYTEHQNDFSIYWYVLKYDDSNGYHIDGCVVYNPSPAIGVTIKNWYATNTETEWNSTLNATVKVTEKDTATGKSYNGTIQYTIPDSPIITFKTPVLTKKTNLNLTYQYKFDRTEEVKQVTVTTNTIVPPTLPDSPQTPEYDPPVTEVDDTDVPLVEDPGEVDEQPVEEIEDEDTPLTDAPVETPTEEAVEVIEDNETPLTDAPAVESIDDEVTPLAAAPQTGVTGSAGAAALPFMVAAAAITAFFKRRRNQD